MIKNKKGKKGQIMGMPFQFIFALIIIAVALFVGIWAIKAFLGRAEQANFGLFINDLENEIISVWQKEEASKTITLSLSTKISYVCFVNRNNCYSNKIPPKISSDLCSNVVPMWSRTGKDNLFFYPGGIAERYDSHTAWHIKCGTKECLDIDKTICIPVKDGNVKFRLTKESGQLVKVSSVS